MLATAVSAVATLSPLPNHGLAQFFTLRDADIVGTATSTVRYAWNGMLPWAELDGSNRILRTFTWGLDLSGGVGGSGGIGGLVAMRSRQGIGTNYLVRTDGKGNVTEVRRTNAVIVATYTYAPFGNIITNTGTYAQPFRFQTKLAHGKSGLGYWGYRWYEPRTGRWISRDQIGEIGGLNLYAYCHNSPLSYSDPHGEVAPLVALGVAAALLLLSPDWVVAPDSPQAQCSTAYGSGEGIAGILGGGISLAVGGAVMSKAGPVAGRLFGGSGARNTTAFRYVSAAEARVAQRSGFVPNVTQAGKTKSVFYSPDKFTSASAAEDALRIGGKNPLGPTATPTHRISVDASGANWGYGGSVEGAAGVELITTEQLPVLRIDPLVR